MENGHEISNTECWYRTGSLKTVASEMAKYRHSDSTGLRVVAGQHTILHFYVENGI
jgi:hypothetical protein